MPESKSHKQRKYRDAGITGKPEFTLPSGRRLDVLSKSRIATQIERGRTTPKIRHSAEVLLESIETRTARKARLRVHHTQLDTARDIMREIGLRGELTNLTGSYKEYVPKQRKR